MPLEADAVPAASAASAAGAVPGAGAVFGAGGAVPLEAVYLGLSVALGLATILLYGLLSDIEFGLRWGASARDVPMRSKSLVRERLGRAIANFGETFPLFAAAIVATIALERTGTGTAWGAALYFWGRLAYVPLYAFGVPWLRSVAWFVAIFGIILVTLPLLGL